MTEVRCAHCGSDDVWRSRISYWSKDRGCWVDEDFSDDFGCNECGHSELVFADAVPDPGEMEALLNDVFRAVVWNKYGWGRKEVGDGKG